MPPISDDESTASNSILSARCSSSAYPDWSVIASLSLVLVACAILCADSASVPGHLNIARSSHQATLLADGRVLVTGGSDDQGRAVGPAEIYNPITGAWLIVERNLVPRFSHAAALLQDGRTLVVGGVATTSPCQPLDSAELYDPSSDRWALTADVPVPTGRGSIAVTLADGRVLVAGGETSCGHSVSSAALFDPTRNTWTLTASMSAARHFHVALFTTDGRVLVSGGLATASAPAAEMFDPKTGTWTAVGESDSRYLVGTTCDGFVRTHAAAIELATLILRATSDECSSVTVLPDRRLLVAGGPSQSRTAREFTELIDLASGSELTSRSLVMARAGHTATRLANGTVLVAGGHNGTARLAATEIYVPPLPYTATVPAILRGGTDRIGQFSYGQIVASSMNSRGHLLIAYRDGDPPISILEWNPSNVVRSAGAPGRDRYNVYVKAIGDGQQQFHSVRVDQHDNIWGVSSTAKEIVEFSPDGGPLLRFSNARLDAPADIAWDANGNLFVADNGSVPKVVKFDRRGRFVAETRTDNASNDTLKSSHSLATDAVGNVYVADAERSRIAVFDNGLTPRAFYYGMGDPWALCIARGPREYLYSASNPDKSDGRRDRMVGEIYRLSVDGTVLGQARGDEAGVGMFPTLLHIDCRGPNELVGVGIPDYVWAIKFVAQ